MIRGRCRQCGYWHSSGDPACPACDSVCSAGLPGRPSTAILADSSRVFQQRLNGSLLGRARLPRLLDWWYSTVREGLELLLRRPGWRPAFYGFDLSFVPLSPEEVYGLDHGRVDQLERKLKHLGYKPLGSFLIPEEHDPALYLVSQLETEQTWALLRVPGPNRLDGSRWNLTLHSRLLAGENLISCAHREEGPDRFGGFERIRGQDSPENLSGLHRQQVFQRGGARPAAGNGELGIFLCYYRGYVQALGERFLETGHWRQGQVQPWSRTSARFPWAEAATMCSWCGTPLADDEVRSTGRGPMCCQCHPEPSHLDPPVSPSLIRRLLLKLLLVTVGLFPWIGLEPALAVAALPLVTGILEPLGHLLLGWRLVDEEGRPANWCGRVVRWICWWSLLPFLLWPLLRGRRALHEQLSGVFLTRPRVARE